MVEISHQRVNGYKEDNKIRDSLMHQDDIIPSAIESYNFHSGSYYTNSPSYCCDMKSTYQSHSKPIFDGRQFPSSECLDKYYEEYFRRIINPFQLRELCESNLQLSEVDLVNNSQVFDHTHKFGYQVPPSFPDYFKPPSIPLNNNKFETDRLAYPGLDINICPVHEYFNYNDYLGANVPDYKFPPAYLLQPAGYPENGCEESINASKKVEKLYSDSASSRKSANSGEIEGANSDSSQEKKYFCFYKNCNMRFKRRFNFKTHYATHFNIRKYLCNLCSRYFSRKYDLIRHLKLSHRDCANMQLEIINSLQRTHKIVK